MKLECSKTLPFVCENGSLLPWSRASTLRPLILSTCSSLSSLPSLHHMLSHRSERARARSLHREVKWSALRIAQPPPPLPLSSSKWSPPSSASNFHFGAGLLDVHVSIYIHLLWAESVLLIEGWELRMLHFLRCIQCHPEEKKTGFEGNIMNTKLKSVSLSNKFS